MIGRLIAAMVVALAAVFFAEPAAAVPSFAVQTGQPCQSCHVGGFGPQLTQYGRDFKIGGYVERAVPWNIPLAAQVIGSFTATRKAHASPPAGCSTAPPARHTHRS
jgi:hypothetical protein